MELGRGGILKEKHHHRNNEVAVFVLASAVKSVDPFLCILSHIKKGLFLLRCFILSFNMDAE